MTQTTTELLAQLRRQTEDFLQKAISEWQMLPVVTFSRKMAPDAWSAAQCLEHLNIYGRYYLPAIEKAIRQAKDSGSRPAKEFRAGWLGAYFTQLMRPMTGGVLKSNMKAPKNAVPSPIPDPRLNLAEFIDQQEKMLQLLDAAQSVNLQEIRIPISIAPWLRLKLGDTFQFVIAHIERHVLQAERAMELTEDGSRNHVYETFTVS